jgi:methyl-accepting chemotaxis protein
MDSLFTNFSLKAKILAIVLTLTTLVLSITILFFSINIRKNTVADSKLLADSETKRFASEIDKVFSHSLNTVHSLAGAFRENLSIQKSERDSINKEIIFHALKNNINYLSVWMQYEMNVLDANYKKEHGRQRNLYIRQGEKYIFDQVYKDTADQIVKGLYYQIKDIGKLMITDPYLDESSSDLKGILMVSPVMPMFDNSGKYLGQVGVDLALTNIQKIVQGINPFKSSISYLIAPNKKIAAHSKDTSLYNKDIMEQNKDFTSEYQKAFDAIKQNTTISFEIERKETNTAYYVSFAPIKLGEDGRIWALVTETPINVLTEKSDRLFRITLFVGILGLLFLALILSFSLNKITNRLKSAIDFSNKISNGDLTSKIDVTENDEIGKLVNSMNSMADKIKSIVTNIIKSSGNLAATSTEITKYSSELSEGALSQASSIEEVVASIEEMSSGIHSNSENARLTESISEKALQGIINGSKSAHLTLASIREIAKKISLVDEISKQTNILALNAAIEAARAGQFGKGFTVVANEVKKLAERAQETAAQIDTISAKGVEISIIAEKELTNLVPDVEKTAELIRSITNSSVEQSSGAELIQDSVMELNNIAQKNASLSEQLNFKAQQLSDQAALLKDFIQYFKI